MSLEAKVYLTPEEYLANERKAERRSEYFAGEVFAMAGAGEAHNLIVANIISELRAQFKERPCRVYPSDMRVKVSATGLYTYPDVVAVCGESKFEDDLRDTLLNPSVIFEVLSESTEAYDRGKKFKNYRKLESVLDYLLVDPKSYRIEHYIRQPQNRWLLVEISGAQETVHLESIGCELALAEVYDKVEIGESVNR